MNAQPPRPAPPDLTLDEPSLARLRDLDPDGRHGLVQRVLQTYETSLVRQLAKAAEARDRGDIAAVSAVAHMLKSSSASIGALALAAHCNEIERAARAGTLADLAAEVETLLTEGGRALAAVRAMLRP